MGENKLFDEFQAVSADQWNDAILKDLKGTAFENKMIWAPAEGIRLKPFYRFEDLENVKFPEELLRKPGDANKWENREEIYIDDIREANLKALGALKRGADAICFNTKNIREWNKKNIRELLNNINPETTPVHFLGVLDSWKILQLFAEETKSRKIDKFKIKGSVNVDFIGYLNVKGDFLNGEKNDIAELKKAVIFANENLPAFRVVSVLGNYFHNAGASVVQELAFALSAGNEYLEILTEEGLRVDDILKQIHFTFATGPDYFPEIAKIRAARYLWTKIASCYHPASGEFSNPYIHSVTSTWNKTIYDPYANVLRTTTEAMSAIIGGSDSLTVKPFDLCYKKSDDFSERIARNQQVIMKEESYLDKVKDPSAGSYYIENITSSIILEAWRLFLRVQEEGGYIKSFTKGFIRDEVQKAASLRDLNIALKKEILLGTNQYANPAEKAEKKITLECHNKQKNKTTSRQILKQYRGAAVFERIRLLTERSKKVPVVFPLVFGNPVQGKARAAFAINFFSCAGFQVIESYNCETIGGGITEALKRHAEITVLCSSDNEYEATAPVIYDALKDKTIIAIAGNPKKAIEKLKTVGLHHFIYTGCNIPDTLQQFQEELNIKVSI